jgi:hypothetical protein
MWFHRVKPAAALLTFAFLVSCSAPAHQARPARHASVPARHASVVLHLAPLRPAVIGRAAWHADEKDVRQKPLYESSTKAVFIHHTDNSNNYNCKTDVPGMLQAIEERHIDVLQWDDLGYNFIVDRCGNIYEGRAGGVDRAVRGAHSEGFNADSVGIAALGNFGAGQKVPRPMLQAIAAIAAWKLDPGVDPMGRVRLVSSNDKSRYPKGTSVELNAISGHRDVFATSCPGDALYAALPWVRRTAARIRQESTW